VKIQRASAVGLLLLVFAGMTAMFIQVIWIPLYRNREDDAALQVDVEQKEGTGTRSWSIADPKAASRLNAGLRSATFGAPPEQAVADQGYRLRIRRPDNRMDEYEVVLGSEGALHDRFYVIRRSGGTPIYGTVYNTPELRSALQQVLAPPAPK
jgi:hypothetical protein